MAEEDEMFEIDEEMEDKIPSSVGSLSIPPPPGGGGHVNNSSNSEEDFQNLSLNSSSSTTSSSTTLNKKKDKKKDKEFKLNKRSSDNTKKILNPEISTGTKKITTNLVEYANDLSLYL